MNLKSIREARKEALKFIERTQDVEKELAHRHDKNLISQYKSSDEFINMSFFSSGSCETSALRRQSMELTRSLSKLRKSE